MARSANWSLSLSCLMLRRNSVALLALSLPWFLLLANDLGAQITNVTNDTATPMPGVGHASMPQRIVGFILVLLVGLFGVSYSYSQITGIASDTSSPAAASPAFVSPPQDPQAMSILNRVLAAGGGTQAIAGVSDYTATGSFGAGAQPSSVTIHGLGGWEFRMDVSGPTGTHSSGVHQGMVFSKADDDTVSIPQQKGNPPNRFALPVWTPLFPAGFAFQSAFVAHIVSTSIFGVSYLGVTKINGRSAHDIQIVVGPFTAASQPGKGASLPRPTRDLFIDTSTFQIVAFRETVPRNPTHEVDYSDYRVVNGVLMPFMISESFGGQTLPAIQINQIVFNTGLQPLTFAVQ